jgi:putative ATPase
MDNKPLQIPLPERLRPNILDDIVGQQHLVGLGKPLRRVVESGKMHSMIFWGPPGVGKTTIARILANAVGMPFFGLSAISSGVKELREVIEKAKESGQAVLFIDEIHRFNKSQQDALLGAVESGILFLVGATTENPSFEVNSALLSRCQVYVLESLNENDLRMLLRKAMETDEELKALGLSIAEDEALLTFSGADGRKLLNLLEIVAGAMPAGETAITNAITEDVIQRNIARYDKSGEQHYDIISAFIKSMRGSDPNAALYWLGRMLVAGEDPVFIARRMLILSSEDIGNANPNALLLAQSCFDAVRAIGMPECRIILGQTAVYLATSAKSNASYMGINEAMSMAERTAHLPVPLHLRNAVTGLMKKLGYGKQYQYAHSHEGNFVDLEFLPDEIKGTKLYDPGNNPREEEQRKWLRSLWKGKYGY